jgi:hypothetical protein
LESEGECEMGAGDGARFGFVEVLDDAGAEGAGGGGDDPVAGFGCEEEERGIFASVADGVREGFLAEARGEAHAGGDGGHGIEWVVGAGGVG